MPSGEEGEGSQDKRAESEVRAWGSWTKVRGEVGNPCPSGHSPFPAQRGQGNTFRRCPRIPPKRGLGWGQGTPGEDTRTSCALQVHREPRPGFPASASPPGHIAAEGNDPPPVPPHPPPPPPQQASQLRGLRPGRAPDRAAAAAVSGAPAPRRPGSCQLFRRSLCRRLPRTPAEAERGHGE